MAKSAIIPSTDVRNFRDLVLWQEAMDLAVRIHKAAARNDRDDTLNTADGVTASSS